MQGNKFVVQDAVHAADKQLPPLVRDSVHRRQDKGGPILQPELAWKHPTADWG